MEFSKNADFSEVVNDYNTKRDMPICSDDCHDKFLDYFDSFDMKKNMGVHIESIQNIEAYFRIICLNFISCTQPDIMEKSRRSLNTWSDAKIYYRVSEATEEFWEIKKAFREECLATLAGNMQQAGRYPDAAKIYEMLGEYDHARKMRERDKRVEVRQTNVSVDLNSLLKQVKDGGIVAVYRCPHCGGKLKISEATTLNSLKQCEHCSSEFESMDLADFFKTVLS